MGCRIVEEWLHELASTLGGFRLRSCEGTEGNQHGAVNCPGIIQEHADYLLKAFYLFGVKRSRSVGVLGVLCSGTVGGCRPRMRRVLWCTGWDMLETCEGLVNVAWHANINVPCCPIPLQGHPKVLLCGSVDCYGIMFLESGDKVLGIILSSIFHKEIIDDKAKGSGSCFVGKQTGNEAGLDVARCFKEDKKLIIGER